jgi:hypothetical protein
MKRTLILLFFAGILDACDQSQEPKIEQQAKKMEKIANGLSIKNGCPIKFKQGQDGTDELIKVIFDCPAENNLFPGKLLLDSYYSLQEQNISFDLYNAQSLSNNIEIQYPKNLLKLVDVKRDLFFAYLDLVKHKELNEFWNHLSPDLQRKLIKQDFLRNTSSLVSINYPDFDGFAGFEFDGKRYVEFRVSNKDKYVSMTLCLEGNNVVVHGFEIV